MYEIIQQASCLFFFLKESALIMWSMQKSPFVIQKKLEKLDKNRLWQNRLLKIGK